MKTVRDACELQPNALSIKLSDQIEQLDELIHAEGDGSAFFGRTSITQGMQDLITEGIARLAGASTQAVFHLKQAMGGGKTHLLVGFGLLAKHPALRKKYCGGDANSQMFGEARIAAFNGRNSPPHFFWGEIAQQLGQAERVPGVLDFRPEGPGRKGLAQALRRHETPSSSCWMKCRPTSTTSPRSRSARAPWPTSRPEPSRTC